MAGHGRRDVHQAAFEGKCLVPLGHVLGEIAQQAAGIGLAEQRRCLAHRDRARAEGFDGETERHQLLAALEQALDRRLIHLDDLGDQEDLPLHAVGRQRSLQPLVDDALMRGVLVDDDQAVTGLRDDVGLVDLGARGAERAIDEVGRRLRLDPHIRAGRADVECGLGALRESRCGRAVE